MPRHFQLSWILYVVTLSGWHPLYLFDVKDFRTILNKTVGQRNRPKLRLVHFLFFQQIRRFCRRCVSWNSASNKWWKVNFCSSLGVKDRFRRVFIAVVFFAVVFVFGFLFTYWFFIWLRIYDLWFVADNVWNTLGICGNLTKIDIFWHDCDILDGYLLGLVLVGAPEKVEGHSCIFLLGLLPSEFVLLLLFKHVRVELACIFADFVHSDYEV